MTADLRKNKRKKQESFLFLLMGLILLGLMVSGYFLFVEKILPGIASNKGTPNTSNDTTEASASKGTASDSNSLLAGEGQIVTLYFASKDKDKLVREIRKIPQEKMLLALATNIVTELIKGPFTTDARKAIPDGTMLKSIFFNQGTFFIDLSREFVDKHPGGAAEEVLTIYSIVNTLTELDKKAKVKFLINGGEVESLKGHLSLRQLFARFEPILASTL
ncbi:MAG: GerMN domain-containing protein [Candidatus Riflebacteria bacterium]|nr:GerMN domain-containing protein [Candidatus Riflebacteria bacterium]